MKEISLGLRFLELIVILNHESGLSRFASFRKDTILDSLGWIPLLKVISNPDLCLEFLYRKVRN